MQLFPSHKNCTMRGPSVSVVYFQGPQEIAVMHCCCKITSAIFFFLIKLKFLGCSVTQDLAISLTLLTIFEQYQAWTRISLLYFQGPQEIAVVHCCCKNTSAILFFSYQTQMVTYERGGSCEHCHQKCITFLSNSVVKIDAHLISQNNYFVKAILVCIHITVGPCLMWLLGLGKSHISQISH